MQIRKSKDHRVNEVADLIEHLQDIKYHIKPFELAEAVVQLIDDLHGKQYAQKIMKHINEEKNYRGTK